MPIGADETQAPHSVQSHPVTINLRASAMPRVEVCPGSAFLPAVETSSGPATLGTAVHRGCAAIVQGKSLPEAFDATLQPQHDETRSLLYKAADMWADTQRFFPNPLTETVLEYAERDSGLVVTGHADVLSVPGDGTVMLADWKSGWNEFSDYTAQLKTYALMAWAQSGVMFKDLPVPERAYAAILWLRTRQVEGMWFTRDELAEWRDDLTRLCRQRDRLVISDHCKYCPAANCPALNARATAMFGPEPVSVTQENVLEWHAIQAAAEKRLEELKIAIAKTIRNSGPVPAGEGKVLTLRNRTTTKITLNEPIFNALCERYGKAAVIEAVSPSKTAIETAVKAWAKQGGQKIGDAIKEAMDWLRQLNAVQETNSQFVGIGKAEDGEE